MTDYRKKGRRLSDLTARDIDEMRYWHDRAELDRYDREQMEREPREERSGPPRPPLTDPEDFKP